MEEENVFLDAHVEAADFHSKDLVLEAKREMRSYLNRFQLNSVL